MSYIDYLEHHLGQLSGGWKPTDGEFPMLVVRFEDTPFELATTFVTLGLSERPLRLPQERTVRQELVTCADSRVDPTRIAAMMAGVCEVVQARGEALLRGEVFGPGNPFADGSSLVHLYITEPTFLPDAVAEYGGVDPVTVLAWLVPITEGEADYVATHGWEAFEMLLETADPDLFDLHRASCVPAT